LAGKVRVPWARLMVTTLSSMGWRITSRTRVPNSGTSSRKSTPWWARLISPGRVVHGRCQIAWRRRRRWFRRCEDLGCAYLTVLEGGPVSICGSEDGCDLRKKPWNGHICAQTTQAKGGMEEAESELCLSPERKVRVRATKPPSISSGTDVVTTIVRVLWSRLASAVGALDMMRRW